MINIKDLTLDKIFAIILIVFFIFLSFYIVPPILEWHTVNNELQHERTFHISFSYDLSGQIGRPESEKPDIRMDISLTYPHGALIVDDPIYISGIAILKDSIDVEIERITIYFVNAQAHPAETDEDGITKSQELYMWKKQNENTLTGNTTIVWNLEGTYHPRFGYKYNELGKSTGKYVGEIQDVSITVYPKAELAQIITNNVSMSLAIILYFLTMFGMGSLILSLWDRTPSSKNNKQNDDNDITEINKNEKSNKNIKIQNSNKSKPE